MIPFEKVFPDVARAEYPAFVLRDDRGRGVGSFVFREVFCEDPRCDCGRVVVQALWADRPQVAASIEYVFPRRAGEMSQLGLDPYNQQSELAEPLLDVFAQMLDADPTYRARLLRHYAMLKAAQVPAKRPAKRRSTRKPKSTDAALKIVAAKGKAADGKTQQRFRRLLDKVERLKQRLRAWRTGRADIDREIAIYRSVAEREHGLLRQLATRLDRACSEAKLSKADRKLAASIIVDVVDELLQAGGHDDLRLLRERHYSKDAAATDKASVEALKAMLEMFGMEYGDADVSSIDELEAATTKRLRDMEEAEVAAAEARRARRKKSQKQLTAESRRDEERRDAHKAVQEVYRALARALHPDREQDPIERERKTVLMSEVNVAYEARDLLRLLELQLELERVGPEDAAPAEEGHVAEERLARYIRILDEQARQLAMELDELTLPFRGGAGAGSIEPEDVIAEVRKDTVELEARAAALATDLEMIADDKRLKAWLKNERAAARQATQATMDTMY